ncbi:MAG: hypothetical protein ACFFBD_00550 [Candidatus Hodarchaeota archaeon]
MLDPIYGVGMILSSCVSGIIGLAIIQRDPSKKLNQTFSLVMFAFAGYLSTEGIIYILDLIDISLILLIRAVSLIFSTSSAVLLGLCALIVRHGDEVAENKLNLIVLVLSIAILLIIGIPGMWVETVDYFGFTYIIFRETIIGTILLRGAPLVLIMFAVVEYLTIRYTSNNPVMRQKLLRLSIGLLLILIGIFYFTLFPYFLYPGLIAYLLGLLFMFWAFR